MAKSEILRLRLTTTELDAWKQAAELGRAKSLSDYVREAVTARAKVDGILREQEAREREDARMHRIAAKRLSEMLP
jgi:uncharacterized protein (DUF1778 family)